MLFYAHYTLVGSDRAPEEVGLSYAMKDLRHMLLKLKCELEKLASLAWSSIIVIVILRGPTNVLKKEFHSWVSELYPKPVNFARFPMLVKFSS